MKWLASLYKGVDITSDMVIVAICVLAGAIILTNFTRISGVLGFLLNAVALFAGASLANYLGTQLELPMSFSIERTLLVAMTGILVTSFLVLLLFPRPRQG